MTVRNQALFPLTVSSLLVSAVLHSSEISRVTIQSTQNTSIRLFSQLQDTTNHIQTNVQLVKILIQGHRIGG